MIDQSIAPPIAPPEGDPMQPDTREYLDNAIRGLEARIQQHIGLLVAERDQRFERNEGAIAKRLTRADFQRMMREYTIWQDRRMAVMLETALTKHVGTLRDEVNRMAGTIEGWGTYKDRAVDDLSRRTTKLENDIGTWARRQQRVGMFVLELSYDVRGGNPAAPKAPSLSQDIHDLKTLLEQQQVETSRMFSQLQENHEREMAALKAQVAAQAGMLDLLLALPRMAVNTLKHFTGFRTGK